MQCVERGGGRGGGGEGGGGRGRGGGESSLVPSPHVPPGEKRSGEQSQISWAYYPKVVRTNEIARSVIITQHAPYNSKICSSPYPYFF